MCLVRWCLDLLHVAKLKPYIRKTATPFTLSSYNHHSLSSFHEFDCWRPQNALVLYPPFCVWLISFNTLPQGSTIEWHFTGLPSFERLNNSPLYVYLSIHLLIDYNLWTLWILLWWTWECRYLFCTHFISIPWFHFLWMVPRRGIARLCSPIFIFLKTLHILFHSGWPFYISTLKLYFKELKGQVVFKRTVTSQTGMTERKHRYLMSPAWQMEGLTSSRKVIRAFEHKSDQQRRKRTRTTSWTWESHSQHLLAETQQFS